MKTAFLRHYGKIFLTILALGAGSYFHVDVGKAVDAIGKLFPDTTSQVSDPTATEAAAVDADAGK